MGLNKKRLFYIRALFIASIFFIWLLLLRFNSINSPFMRDEGEYAYAAQLLHDGGIPYKESFMQKLPMIIYTYSLAETFGDSVSFPRILALISLFLTGLVLADILRKEYNSKTAIVFLFLFSPLISFYPLEGFFAQPEIFLLLPMAISLWCYFKWRYTRESFWLYLVGFFGFVSILYKPIISLAIFFIFLYILLFEIFNNKTTFVKVVKYGLFIFLGGLSATLIVILPIFLKGGLSSMWDSAFYYNYYYSSLIGLNFRTIFYYFVNLWPFYLLIIYFIFKVKKNRLLFISILFGCYLGTFGSLLLHYYLIIIPMIAVISSISIINLEENYSSIFSNYIRNFITILICILLFLLLFFQFKDYLFVKSKNFTNSFCSEWQFSESMLLAKELKNITKENDKIFIFGNAPEILYYAHRRSATRFVITYPIILKTKLSEKYGREAVSDLILNPPKAIITNHKLNLSKISDSENDNYRYEVMSIIKNSYNFVGQVYFDEESNDYSFGFPRKENVDILNLSIYIRK